MAAPQEREDLKQKLDDFLEDHRSFLDEQTTFQLLASHSHEHALLRFATHCVDDSSPQKFERVTAHRIYIVATCDRELKRRLRKIPGVPLISIKERRYQVERMPEGQFK